MAQYARWALMIPDTSIPIGPLGPPGTERTISIAKPTAQKREAKIAASKPAKVLFTNINPPHLFCSVRTVKEPTASRKDAKAA